MTFNLLRKEITSWFENLELIKHIYWGSDSDYNAILDKKYYSVQLELLNLTPREYVNEYQINISVMDLMDINDDVIPNNDYKLNIQSDCIRIINAFINDLNLGKFNGVFPTNATYPNIVPFEDATVDVCAGATVTLVLETIRDQIAC